MKLAEALAARADLMRRLADLRERAVASMWAAADDTSVEDAAELLAEADRASDQLETLVRRINATNIATPFDDHGITGTLTDALARRETLGRKHKTLADVLANSRRSRRAYFDDHAEGSSLRVDTAALRARSDELAAAARRLDLTIQAMNWQIDLLEG